MLMIILREDATSRDREASEVIKMEKTYMEYIQEHVRYVQQAYRDLFFGKTIFANTVDRDELTKAVYSIADEVAHHDESKYSDEEFHSYRKWYYPTKAEQDKIDNDEMYKKICEDEYNKSWEHHALVNDHHPKHWKYVNGHFDENSIPQEMTLGAIIHAICDWEAMSRKFNTNTLEWYEKEADDEKSYMAPHTREIFDDLLYVVFKK